MEQKVDDLDIFVFGEKTSRNQLLDHIGNRQAKECFVGSYFNGKNFDETTEEGLGIAICKWAQWDGMKIMRVFMAALEDSNFHTEAGVVAEWLEKVGAE